MLSLVMIRLGALEELLVRSGREAEAEAIKELVTQSLECSRSVTFELCPPVLYELGVEAAAEQLLERVQKQHGVRIDLQGGPSPIPLNENLRYLVFRIIRELVFNVVKHAQIARARLVLKQVDDFFCIEMEDEGVGFDPSSVFGESRRSTAFGLFSLQERLRRIGGTLRVESQPGRGTRVSARVPLRPQTFAGEARES